MIWSIGLGIALAVVQQQTPANQIGQLPEIKAPPPRVQDPSVPPVVKLPNEEATPDPTLRNLTADDAARIALKLNPTLGTAIGAIQQARGVTTQQRSQLLPQVLAGTGYDLIEGLSGTAGTLEAPYLDPIIGISEVSPFIAAVQVRQLIFDFNHTLDLVKQDQALTAAASANLTVQQQSLVQSVKSAFYSYANAQRLVDVNADNETNRQRQLDLANARFSSGIGVPIDVVNAESSKAQAIFALNQARQNAELARVALLNQMGVDPLTPILVSKDLSEAPMQASDAKALIAQAEKSRPEVRSAQLTVQAYGFGLSAAKTTDLPSVYVSGAAGANGNSFLPRSSVGALSIGLQWPVFDGGLRTGAVQEANGQLTQAQSNLQSAMLNVQTDVANAYLALQTAEQNVTLTNAEVANSQEGVRIAEGRYTAGLGPFQDVLTAQALLVTAQTDQTTARNAVDQALVQLKHAIGLMF